MEQLIKNIKEYASKINVKILDGHLPKKENSIFLIIDDFKEFLNLASKLNINQVILETIHTEFNEDSRNREKLQRMKEKYNDKISGICVINLIWINQGFAYIFSHKADWYNELLEEEAEEETIICIDCGREFIPRGFRFFDKEYCLDCHDRNMQTYEKKREEYAKKIARDEGFAKCSNKNKRGLYIEKKFPELKDNKYISIGVVADLAKAILDMKK